MKLAFILDPLDSIQTYKDTSFAMMREAARAVLPIPCMYSLTLFMERSLKTNRAHFTPSAKMRAFLKI